MMTARNNKWPDLSRYSIHFAGLLVLIFFAVLLYIDLSPVGEQQFSFLADSFLHGKLHFLEEPGSWIDTSPHNGKNFWPLGPLPAVILIPFVFLFSLAGKFFSQAYLQPFLVAGVFCLVFRFARSFPYSRADSLFWAFGFTFASVFVNVAVLPWSWWYAQVITVLLIWAGLWEYLNKKRFWLLGVIVGALFLTRSTAGLFGILCLLDIAFPENPSSNRHKAINLFRYSVPVAVAILLLWLYNYLRFDDFLEQGYSLQIVLNDSLAQARDYGLLSVKHVPGNLYYFLLSMPLPVFRDQVSHVLQAPFVVANPWGMSIFATSPYLFLLMSFRYGDRLSRQLLITALAIGLPIMFYYGIGFRQMGYRYSLDFLPILYLLLMKKYHESRGPMSTGLKLLLISVACSNLYLFSTLFTQR